MSPSLRDLNKLEFKASRSDVSLTFISLYGDAGHGSASPWELIWKNPLPAARQPPEVFSYPGNDKNNISKIIDNTHNGEIILLHATSKTNMEILDTIIKKIKDIGYDFKTLDEFEK